MVEGSRVWVSYDGGRLSGDILRLSPRSIEVGMTAPHCGITQGLSIPYFACWAPYVSYYQSVGRITAHGVETAEWLLICIGQSCELVAANSVELRREYLALAREATAETDGLSESEYRAARTTLRSALKRADLSGPAYQRQ